MDLRRIQHMENLGDARFDAAFALARRDPHRPAEQLEEIVRRFVVPQIDGPAAPRDAAEFLADARRLADGVKQNLRIEPAEQGTRVVLLIALVRGIRFRRELIGSRRRDRANQPVQIVLMIDKRPGERVEQFGIGRGIGRAEIVDRFDNAATEKMSPTSGSPGSEPARDCPATSSSRPGGCGDLPAATGWGLVLPERVRRPPHPCADDASAGSRAAPATLRGRSA